MFSFSAHLSVNISTKCGSTLMNSHLITQVYITSLNLFCILVSMEKPISILLLRIIIFLSYISWELTKYCICSSWKEYFFFLFRNVLCCSAICKVVMKNKSKFQTTKLSCWQSLLFWVFQYTLKLHKSLCFHMRYLHNQSFLCLS